MASLAHLWSLNRHPGFLLACDCSHFHLEIQDVDCSHLWSQAQQTGNIQCDRKTVSQDFHRDKTDTVLHLSGDIKQY